MRIAYSDEQIALRDELRAYLAEHWTPERKASLGPRPAEYGGPEYRAWVRQMGEAGWLGVGWPTEYGGKGLSFVEEYIFLDEMRRVDAPIPLVTMNTVGPTLQHFGSDEQKSDYLPRILAGEIHFAIAYTEPSAGTDLASLSTRAVPDGDGYVINGQKVFTTGGHDADYLWLAARTDPEAPKHKGLTIFIVPTSADGVKATPIMTLDDGRTNAMYLEDVRVGPDAIVGGLNNGWKVITGQLNHERVALAVPGKAIGLYDDVLTWARETGAIERPWVRRALARIKVQLDAIRLLNWRMVWAMSSAELNPAEASVVKVFGTEAFVEIFRALGEVVGTASQLKAGSPGAVLAGKIDLAARWSLILTFGGGVNEIQREIIAIAGLGMPRGAR